MTFRDDGDYRSSDVSGGGGGGGGRGLAIGGGVGGIVIVIVALLFGVDPSQLGLGAGPNTSSSSSTDSASVAAINKRLSECEANPSLANRDTICRIKATTISLNDVWSVQLPAQARKKYVQPQTKIFSGGINTGCGAATAAVGPFYCPADNQVYIDPSFFDSVLKKQLGGSDDPASQEYVLAHEFGHHIQTMLGDIKRSQQDPKGASSGAVRVELQADCYGGLWFHYATTTKARNGQAPLLAKLTPTDIDNVIKTALAIGDDHIQKVGGGRVNPNSWTHGSSEMRRQWFTIGYEQGSMQACDTFGANL